jgi:hypothetical protein
MAQVETTISKLTMEVSDPQQIWIFLPSPDLLSKKVWETMSKYHSILKGEESWEKEGTRYKSLLNLKHFKKLGRSQLKTQLEQWLISKVKFALG